MALVSKPSDYSSATAALWSILNTLKNTIYDEFNGNIDDANIKSGAAITPSKVADTAVVIANTVAPGTQTITRPTTVSGGPFYETAQGGFTFDASAGNIQTNDINGATTFALTAGKGVYRITTTGAETLTTITGGTEGDVIYLISDDTDLTITHTVALTANTFWLRGVANYVVNTSGACVIRLRYTEYLGTGKWFEC